MIDWWLNRDWAETAALVSIVMSTFALLVSIIVSTLTLIMTQRQINVSRQIAQEEIDASRQIARDTIKTSRQIAQEGIDASRRDAQEFGDVAGTKAAIRHEKEKDEKMYMAALQVLHGETYRIQELAEHNKNLAPGSARPQVMAHLPTTIFETAILSKESMLYHKFTIPVTPAQLDTIVRSLAYLTTADLVNAHISTHTALTVTLEPSTEQQRRDLSTKVVDECKNLLPKIEILRSNILEEMKKAEKQ